MQQEALLQELCQNRFLGAAVQPKELQPSSIRFLVELESDLEDCGLKDVYLSLPPREEMEFSTGTMHEPAYDIGLRIGAREGDGVWVYLPQNINNLLNSIYPPIRQETQCGNIVESDMVWGSKHRPFDAIPPFCFMRRERNDAQNKHPFYAMISWYYFLAGFDQKGVRWAMWREEFVKALEDIKENTAYQKWASNQAAEPVRTTRIPSQTYLRPIKRPASSSATNQRQAKRPKATHELPPDYPNTASPTLELPDRKVAFTPSTKGVKGRNPELKEKGSQDPQELQQFIEEQFGEIVQHMPELRQHHVRSLLQPGTQHPTLQRHAPAEQNQNQGENTKGVNLLSGAVSGINVRQNQAQEVPMQKSGANKRKSWLEQEQPMLMMKKCKVEQNTPVLRPKNPQVETQDRPTQEAAVHAHSVRSGNSGPRSINPQAKTRDPPPQQSTVKVYPGRSDVAFRPANSAPKRPGPLQGNFLTQQVGVNVEDIASYYAPNPNATSEGFEAKALESERDRIAIRVGQINDILEEKEGNYNRGFHPKRDGLLEELRRVNDRLENARMAQRTNLLKFNLGLT